MNYYNFLEEGNTEQIIRNMFLFLGIETIPKKIKYYKGVHMCWVIRVVKSSYIFIDGDNNIDLTRFDNTINARNIEKFFKYYNRKKVINEL